MAQPWPFVFLQTLKYFAWEVSRINKHELEAGQLLNAIAHQVEERDFEFEAQRLVAYYCDETPLIPARLLLETNHPVSRPFDPFHWRRMLGGFSQLMFELVEPIRCSMLQLLSHCWPFLLFWSSQLRNKTRRRKHTLEVRFEIQFSSIALEGLASRLGAGSQLWMS